MHLQMLSIGFKAAYMYHDWTGGLFIYRGGGGGGNGKLTGVKHRGIEFDSRCNCSMID